LTRNGLLPPMPPTAPPPAPDPPTASVPSFRASLTRSDPSLATNSSCAPANPAPSVARRRKASVPDKPVQTSSVDDDGSLSLPSMFAMESIQHDEVPRPDLLNPVETSHAQPPATVPPSPVSVASAAFPFDNPASSFALLGLGPPSTLDSPSVYSSASTTPFVEELGYANLFPEFAHITSAPLACFSLDNTLLQQVDHPMLLDVSLTPDPLSSSLHPSLHSKAACLPLPVSYTIERSKLNALVFQVRQNHQRQLAQGWQQTDSIDKCKFPIVLR
jgi:hypothetical protein